MKAIHRHAVVSVAAYWALAVLGLLCSVKRKLRSFNGSPLRFLRSLLRKLLIARKQWIIARKNGWNVTLEDLFQSLTHVDL